MHHVQGPRGAALTEPEVVPGSAVAHGSTVAARRVRPTALLVHLALLVLVLDQATKCAVVLYFNDHDRVHLFGGAYLVEARNPGAAFSFLAGASMTIIFTLIAVAVVVTIARYATRMQSLVWATVLGLVLGGALGNLSDRIFRAPAVFRGHVVDWIQLWSYPVFNIADSGIVVGGILGVLLTMRGIGFDGTRTIDAP